MNGYIVSKSKTNCWKIKIESNNGVKKYISMNYYYNNIAEMAQDYLKRNFNIEIENIMEFKNFYVLIVKEA